MYPAYIFKFMINSLAVNIDSDDQRGNGNNN